MSWPTSQDYNEAVQSPASAFTDLELRGGEARANALGMPLPRSGNFADVYEFIGASGARWAVKCFTREVTGLQERYHEISRFLQQAKLPFMVDFQYLAEGIRVGGRRYPILKMHWVDGYLLNEFVQRNLDRPRILEALGDIWARMATRLNAAGIAHADLQHGNVILVPGSKAASLAVRLIDYDGMYVPALAKRPSGEVGHPNFQHPQRLEKSLYSADVDRLPFLAVACALRGLAVGGRKIWAKYDNGDNLLFRSPDLANPAASKLLRELWNTRDVELHDLIVYLVHGLTRPLNETPLLPEVVRDGRLEPPTTTMEKSVQELLGPGAAITRTPPASASAARADGSWEDEAYDPFADLVAPVAHSAVGRSPAVRRNAMAAAGKPWFLWGGLGLGGVAALALIVGFALSGGEKDEASRAELAQPPQPIEKKPTDKPETEKPTPHPKVVEDPPKRKLAQVEKPLVVSGTWKVDGDELVQESFAAPGAPRVWLSRMGRS